MLILTRRPGESLQIGEHITVTVIEQRGQQIQLGIDAPREVTVLRQELTDESPPAAERTSSSTRR